MYVLNVQVSERSYVFNLTVTKRISAQKGHVTGCIVNKLLSYEMSEVKKNATYA